MLFTDSAPLAGVVLGFLPPYHPDFNPEEKFFHVLKAYLRRERLLDGKTAAEVPQIILDACDKLATPELMKNLFRASGLF